MIRSYDELQEALADMHVLFSDEPLEWEEWGDLVDRAHAILEYCEDKRHEAGRARVKLLPV